jgi:chromosome segregation ATPase
VSEPSVEDYRALERKHHELQHETWAQMRTVLITTVRSLDSLTVQVGETNARSGKLEDSTNERFDKVDQRFDKVDERFDKVEKRLDKVDERLDKVDRRFDEVDRRFDKLDSRIEYMIGLVVRDALKAPPALAPVE